MLAALDRARVSERRFLADASHELRTPVTALRGNIDYVRRHGPEPAALEDLEADAARLSALVDNLLTLSREDEAGAIDQDEVRLDLLAGEAAAGDLHVVVDAPKQVRCPGRLGGAAASGRQIWSRTAPARPRRRDDHHHGASERWARRLS